MIFLLITYKFCIWSHRLSVRTHGFHPWKRGSIPLGTAKKFELYCDLKRLIIRTDKLGDFYQTLPYLNSIKRSYGKENLDLLISESIFDHFAEKNYLYNNIYAFPKKGILKKIILIFKLRKNIYNNILILDGKDRSIIFSLLLKSLGKIILYEKKKINFLFKIFISNKNNIIQKDKIISDYDLYNTVLKKMNINNKPIDFNFINYSSLSNIILPDKLSEEFKKYTLIHLDEKWFSKFYIKEFFDINPSVQSFLSFMISFFNTHKQNIIITTGLIKLPFVNLLCDQIFTNIKSNLYEYKYDKNIAILILKTTFKDLEIITMNSKNLITCHTSLSFVAAAFDVNLIDIIDKNNDKEYNYQRHTSHIKKYHKVYRKRFKELSREILLKIEQWVIMYIC